MKDEPSLNEIFQSIGLGLIALDMGGNIIFINTTAENLLGFPDIEVIGNSISDVLPSLGSIVKGCFQSGSSQVEEVTVRGNVKLLAFVESIHRENDLIGATCIFQKIKYSDVLSKNYGSSKYLNKQLEAIFNSSSDGIWVFDSCGIIININSASERLNGIKAKDIIGKNEYDDIVKNMFDCSVSVEGLKAKKQISMMQYVKKTKKYLWVTATPAFDEDGNIFLFVVNERDITQLHNLKEQLKQSKMVSEKIKDKLAELSLAELKSQYIVSESETMQQVLRIGHKLAKLNASNILILGESGTGKGLLAKFIHDCSDRDSKSFIQINCAALPETLLEAELFGYEKGAFTGARSQGKIGLIELAHKGTLFLDEIGEMPLSIQSKLLKYLDDQEILPLGGLRSKKIDSTIIAATNRGLQSMTRAKKFREDLFFRLDVFTIQIPPLRDRREDIFELVDHFLNEYNKKYSLNCRISPETLEALQSYFFPGNVRELKNIMKKAVVMSESDRLDRFILKLIKKRPNPEHYTQRSEKLNFNILDEVKAYEKEIIGKAIFRYKSTRKLAGYLGISQTAVVRKLKRHGLSIK